MVRITILLLATWQLAWGQKPVISPGGVVSAASYNATKMVGGTINGGFYGGSIVSIFGRNLASATVTATTVPLPTELAGTSVMASGLPAPLFYVSPSQINIQLPTHPQDISGVVVRTAAGSSDPYPLDESGAVGIFTADSSGCGQGAVLNVRLDGTVSVNSPTNSVSPGESVAVYGTGAGVAFNPPPDGTPAPANPPSILSFAPGLFLDFAPAFGPVGSFWAGRAPGLIGVDQFNFQIPEGAREGCAVPLQVSTSNGISQPVTIAIHKGGGPCAEPPPAGFGQITWEKTITTSALAGSPTTETDSVKVSLQSSPGRVAANPPAFEGHVHYGRVDTIGAACPVPGYRTLDAGTISVQGPGFGPATAVAALLPDTQAAGLKVYRASLPAGAIQPGAFQVSSAGGTDVSAFQSKVQIGSEIHVTTPLAGRTFAQPQPLTVNWTGGDPDSVVTMRWILHLGYEDQVGSVAARASDGTVTFKPSTQTGWIVVPGRVDLLLEVTPDPSKVVALSASGLSLGGQHTWKYTYRFEGVTLQ